MTKTTKAELAEMCLEDLRDGLKQGRIGLAEYAARKAALRKRAEQADYAKGLEDGMEAAKTGVAIVSGSEAYVAGFRAGLTY